MSACRFLWILRELDKQVVEFKNFSEVECPELSGFRRLFVVLELFVIFKALATLFAIITAQSPAGT